ncbi:hypothetical protein Tco_1530731 [Tanacetum coccineum]
MLEARVERKISVVAVEMWDNCGIFLGVNATFCFFVRNYTSRVKRDHFIYWFEGLSTNFESCWRLAQLYPEPTIDVVNFGDKNGPKGGVIFEPYDYGPLEDSYPGQSKKENVRFSVAAANHNDNSYILHVPED